MFLRLQFSREVASELVSIKFNLLRWFSLPRSRSSAKWVQASLMKNTSAILRLDSEVILHFRLYAANALRRRSFPLHTTEIRAFDSENRTERIA